MDSAGKRPTPRSVFAPLAAPTPCAFVLMHAASACGARSCMRSVRRRGCVHGVRPRTPGMGSSWQCADGRTEALPKLCLHQGSQSAGTLAGRRAGGARACSSSAEPGAGAPAARAAAASSRQAAPTAPRQAAPACAQWASRAHASARLHRSRGGEQPSRLPEQRSPSVSCRRAARAAPGRRCPSKRLQLLGPAVPPPQHRQSALPRQAVSSWPLRAAPRARRRRGASTARRARAPRRSGQARPRTNCLLRRHPAPLTRLVRRRPAPQPAAAAAGAACSAVRRRLEGWGRLCGRRMPQPRCGGRRPPRSGGAAGGRRRSGRRSLARLRAPAQCAPRPHPCARTPHCSSACTPAAPSGRSHTRVTLCELAGTLFCGPQTCCRPRCLSHPPSSHRLCCSHTTEGGGHCVCSTVQDGYEGTDRKEGCLRW